MNTASILARLATLAIIVGISGCAARNATDPFVLIPEAKAPIWPSPPEKPRYKFVTNLIGEKTLASPEDTRKDGIVAVFKWIAGVVFGEKNYFELRRPVSGTTDAKGRILVVDASHRAVVVFDLATRRLLTWRTAARGVAFNSPIAIVPDGAGGFLVTDSELGEVFRLDAEGRPSGRFGKRILTRPTGIARDPVTGTIYVADSARHDIKMFRNDGILFDTLGARGIAKGRFNTPTHLTFSNNELYVADTLNFRVQVFNRRGDGRLVLGKLGLFVGNLTRPKGVAVGADGRIYVVESYHDHLLIFGQRGELLLPIGGTGREAGNFYLPSGVWTDKHKRVYVADMFNGRVAVFQELTSLDGT